MPAPSQTRLFPRAGEIKMRLYGQGLGDCFLLAFPRRGKPKDPCYLVIDCGAAISTPDKDERIRRVVEDIHAATGGHIDALAITHQHYDHISGFQDAWLEWQKITVDAVYLPWTERAAEAGDHKGTKAFREALERAAMKALEEAARAGLLDQPGFRAQADFLGVAIRGEAEAATVQPTDMDGAMAFARGLCPPENIRYFEPGDVFRLPGTEAHGYVLGPPLKDKANEKGKRYIELLVDEKEMYSYGPLGLKVDDGLPGGDKAFALSDDHSLPALASALRVAGAVDRAGDEGFSPFPPEVRLDWDLATGSPFFKNHYGEAKDSIGNGAFRRIDFDWLGQAAQLALRAGDFTNNVSLVLAFDHPKSDKMLLFPGDAQVGNWLSWHTIKEWRLCEGADPARPPAPTEKQTLMENLLSRIAFYKVGHHGSHNATIKDKGLEAMTRPDLVAYVPVSIPVAQDLMGYCPMPFYPVLRALHRKTQGRVFFPNGRPLISRRDGPEKSPETLQEEARIKPSSEMLKEKKDKNGTVLEGPVPLYLEMTVGA